MNKKNPAKRAVREQNRSRIFLQKGGEMFG